MGTIAAEGRRGQGSEFSFARFVDRWIWVFMAVLFLVLVLAGFIPSGIQKVLAIQNQERPPFEWFLHIHAVVMASWMLLLCAQTLLMETGRKKWHMSLGIASLIVAPLVFTMMVVMAGEVLSRANSLPAQTPLANISVRYAFVFTVQGRAIALFAIFFIWAYQTRFARPDTHKRMMLLATWAMIDAGIARIPGSNELGNALGLKAIGLTSRDIPHVWMLVALVPALSYDLIRRERIHYAWVAGLAMFLPFAVASHYLESAPLWWQQFIGEITGRS